MSKLVQISDRVFVDPNEILSVFISQREPEEEIEEDEEIPPRYDDLEDDDESKDEQTTYTVCIEMRHGVVRDVSIDFYREEAAFSYMKALVEKINQGRKI